MRFCSEVVLRTMVLGTLVFGPMALTGLQAENVPLASLDATALTATAALPRVVSVVRVDARTGRLVRSVVVTPPAGSPSASSRNPQVRAMVEETAKSFDVS